MYELDKETFGEFLAKQRKEKGYTQKELAEKLFVSDKAVSKWERALSMPDISLLIPLSKILGVTVTELLEGRKIDQTAGMEAEHVELLVKKALALSEEVPEQVRQRRKKRGFVFSGCSVFMLLEVFLGVWYQHETGPDVYFIFFVFMGIMSFGFGIYFWLFMKERLPAYYDEYEVNAYSDGIFRMNVPGVHFNNRNWPYLVKGLRIWSAVTMLCMPLAGHMVAFLKPGIDWGMGILQAVLFLYLGGMFLPMYILGKKYGKEAQGSQESAGAVRGSAQGSQESDGAVRGSARGSQESAGGMQGNARGCAGAVGESAPGRKECPGKRQRRTWRKKICGVLVLCTVMALLFGGIFLLSDTGIFEQGFCMTRIGYVSHHGTREWSASYRLLSGTMFKKIYPETEPAAYVIQVETKEGSLSMELTNKKGDILFFQSHMETGTYPLTLEGTVKVKIVAEKHRGSFSIAPQQTAGKQQTVSIFLYGETHAQEEILAKEFELWSSYYNKDGMRHLFVELPYYTAEYMNLWMQSGDDGILEQLYQDWEGTAMHSGAVLDFYKRIKRECPETVFHGTDVGHQYDTTGKRFLEYLVSSGQEESETYRLARENLEQGQYYYQHTDPVYRENKMAENFICELESLLSNDVPDNLEGGIRQEEPGGEEADGEEPGNTGSGGAGTGTLESARQPGISVMGIYGSAHTDIRAMDYTTQSVPCMAAQLYQKYGMALYTDDLTSLGRHTESSREDTIRVGEKIYAASYYGRTDLSAVLPDYQCREFWRLEDAYEDFKDYPVTGNVLPYNNYPVEIQEKQVFLIVYTKADGSTIREYHRADGNTWNGSPVTEEVKLAGD